MTAHTLGRVIPLVVVLLNGACAQAPPLTPLAAAARTGDLAAIDQLAAAGVDLNEPSGSNNWPPVIHAIHKGQRPALARLVERGASLAGATGPKALFMASGYGDAETVSLLLSRGVPMPDSVPAAAELIAVAIGGAWDIDYQWSGCDRHTAVARLLVARDADLRVVGILSPTSFARARSTLQYRVARWYAQRKGCDELLRIVGRGEG
jgi:ankyrin repeat protein